MSLAVDVIRGGLVLNGENAGEAIASAQLIIVVFEMGKEPDEHSSVSKTGGCFGRIAG